jgi:YD repeat-containing protein
MDYEPSPLNRASQSKAPGVTTQGVSQTYLKNVINSVRRYATNGPTLYDLDLNLGYYPVNTLIYTQIIDENGKTIQEFRDSFNRVILQRVVMTGQTLDTYYVYSESGQLRAVLQPKFQEESDASLHAFLYEYDARGRLYKKKVPSANPITYTYDSRDRLSTMTDARNQEFYYVYDELNRQTEMGIKVGAINEALVYNFYDNYSFTLYFGNFGEASFTNELNLTESAHFVSSTSSPQTANRQGLLTGTTVRMLIGQ